jgi:hypothetical protein
VPKAAVKENGYALGLENKIGLARKVGVPAPAGESSFAQQPQEGSFCCGVTL